jgi:hypothetical protein
MTILLIITTFVFTQTLYYNIIRTKQRNIKDMKGIVKDKEKQKKKIKIWSSDFHSAVVQDIVSVFTNKHFEYEVDFEIESQSPYCKYFRYKNRTHCTDDKKLNYYFPNMWELYSKKKMEEFYLNYKEKLKDIDIFLCTLPPSICQFFMKFNKILIVIIPVSPLFRKIKVKHALEWRDDLLEIKKNKKNLVISNNYYHKFLTKILMKVDSTFIPSICDYQRKFKYKPKLKNTFLLSRNTEIANVLNEMITKYNLNLVLKDDKKYYNPNETMYFEGVIHFPYAPSVMLFFEHYAMVC